MSDGAEKTSTGLKASRERLENLADKAAKLRVKLETETSLLQSVERLAEQARASAKSMPATRDDDVREDDGTHLASEG